MSIKITICSHDGGNVELAVSSGYNPDILDDLCRRASKAFRKSLKDQVVLGIASAHAEEELAEDTE